MVNLLSSWFLLIFLHRSNFSELLFIFEELLNTKLSLVSDVDQTPAEDKQITSLFFQAALARLIIREREKIKNAERE